MPSATPMPDASDQADLRRLGDAVVIRQAVDNMGWINLGPEGILVVDALEQPELEDDILQDLAATMPGQPVTYVLNTHCHDDHTALNPMFAQRFGAAIVNRRTAHIPAAGRWFEGKLRSVVMLPLPDCHTPADCVIWVPADRVLFVGDIFGWGLIPWQGNLKPEKQEHMVDAFERLIGFDAKWIVPGHGPLCSNAELRRWLDYFHWMRSRVKELLQDGRDSAEIRGILQPPGDMAHWWRFRAWKHDDTLKKVLKAGERGWL